ncbi:hypothetical protein BX070DRAFT_152955 [Coemansia spiralis]|nr:hypothetical protein BX070DRAFT_152955 [Coemansia spiralis]
MWVETIPQILVNYRVRSATLVPIIDSFNFVGTQMIIWILHNAGIDGWFDAPTLYMVPNIICQTIVVVQFFIYYKDKQD